MEEGIAVLNECPDCFALVIAVIAGVMVLTDLLFHARRSCLLVLAVGFAVVVLLGMREWSF